MSGIVDEKASDEQTVVPITHNVYGHQQDHDGHSSTSPSLLGKITTKLLGWGVESRGILPVSPAQRTDPQFSKIFFIFLSANLNILSFSTGTLGPIFGLGLRDSVLVIIFFNILGNLLPAYFATFGPKLGLRQMCQARYSFGYWLTIIPAVINIVTLMGFNILNAILGGQTLASASVRFEKDGTSGQGGISVDVGIVLVSLISLFLSFCGYKVLNIYERVAWFPVLVVYIIALGHSGSHLVSEPAVPLPPATARQILTFGSTVAGFVISYLGLASDYTTYMRQDVQSWKVFTWTFAGLYIPTTLVEILGAAFMTALGSNQSWETAYTESGLTGLLHMILPGRDFSRFLLVIFAFSLTANIAPTLYSITLCVQTALPFDAVLRVPRYVASILATAILIPVAIVGATRFYDTLIDFLGLIGYWAACFGAVILVEHLVFRRGTFANYAVADWDQPRRLPNGVAALASCIIGLGVVVLCMDQVWFVGPIAKHTGDIGFEVGFVVSGMSYCVLRTLLGGLSQRQL